MSGETKTNPAMIGIVIAVCAAIGFGAVYAMVGGGDNRTVTAATEKAPSTSSSSASSSGGGLKNSAVQQAPAPVDSDAKAKAGTRSSAALRGADGKPLNRGAMTTFVFKKQPMHVEKPPAFNGPDGKPMTLNDLKGRVVLLNLWATWCGPCRKEMPYLDALQKELGSDQFEVVAVSVDRGAPDKSKEFLAEVGATSLRFYHDPTAQAGFSLMAIGMPTTLLFDREGREIGRLVGPAEWHSDDAKDLIKAAIAAG